MVTEEPKTRRRGSTDERSATFDFKSIFAGGKIGLELSLGAEDRELVGTAVDDLKEKIDEMTAKVDYRWKITQWLMVFAIGLGTVGQIVTWVI
jgi:hypothetical protein